MVWLLIASGCVQLLLAVHAVGTGRARDWLFIVLAFPVVGSIAYLASVARDRVPPMSPVDEEKDMTALLAESRFVEAAELGRALLEDKPRDARIMYLLALACFGAEEPREAKEWLDELDRVGGGYRPRDRNELRKRVYAQLYA